MLSIKRIGHSVDYFIEKEQRTTLQIKQLAGNKKYITVSPKSHEIFKHYNFGKMCYVLCEHHNILLLHCSLCADKNVYLYTFQITAYSDISFENILV